CNSSIFSTTLGIFDFSFNSACSFRRHPLGIGILATVAVALVGLAMYAISKNNKISELEAMKFVVDSGNVKLQVTKKEFEYIKRNNKNRDKDGRIVEGEYRIDFATQRVRNAMLLLQREEPRNG
ncbi:unnamed protein product, partial [Ceratitis capitata]